MKLEFEKPLVPNFIRTKQGVFSLKELSEEEITEYAELWCNRLAERRKEQQEQEKNGL